MNKNCYPGNVKNGAIIEMYEIIGLLSHTKSVD